LQWTDLWSRLRPTEVNLGAWSTWGAWGPFANGLQRLGIESSTPRKQDYRYNLAFSGARCVHLTQTPSRQTQSLLHRMAADPERWAQGVVVIRIGVNNIGHRPELDQFARDGLSPEARALVSDCVRHIDHAVRLIRAAHPTTRLVLVGIPDNTEWAIYHEFWQDTAALANISRVLDFFDAEVQAIAARDAQAAFLEDRAWFRAYWGTRSPVDGRPAYRALSLGGRDSIRNSIGDDPRNVVIADGHNGTVLNGLWVNRVIELLNARWDTRLTPLSLDEIARAADPDDRFGIRGGAAGQRGRS
jgi:hypothetical protein